MVLKLIKIRELSPLALIKTTLKNTLNLKALKGIKVHRGLLVQRVKMVETV